MAAQPDFWVEKGEVFARTMELAALAANVHRRTLIDWQKKGCPIGKGNWSVSAISAWDREHRRVNESGDEALLDGSDSPALEDYRRVRADIARRELAQLDRQLVPVAELQSLLLDGAGLIRKAGESLGRKYGPESQKILNQAVDAAAELINRLNDSVPDGAA